MKTEFSFTNSRCVILFVLVSFCCTFLSAETTDEAKSTSTDTASVDFVKDVQPILRANCFECHAGEVEEGGLNLGIKSKAIVEKCHAEGIPKDVIKNHMSSVSIGLEQTISPYSWGFEFTTPLKFGYLVLVSALVLWAWFKGKVNLALIREHHLYRR